MQIFRVGDRVCIMATAYAGANGIIREISGQNVKVRLPEFSMWFPMNILSIISEP